MDSTEPAEEQRQPKVSSKVIEIRVVLTFS
jgi:hypothetical protein